MKKRTLRTAPLLLAVMCSSAWAQTCTSTIGPSTTSSFLDSALASASAGAVICLNSGSYGSQTITGRKPSDKVTIRSLTGRGATFSSIRIQQSAHLIFKSLTTNGFWVDPSIVLELVGANSDLTFADNRIQADGSTAGDGRFGLDGGMRMLIYGNLFTGGYRSDGFEGQLFVTNTQGIPSSNVISHNEFDGTGACGDAIQFTSNGEGTVGPGNYFHNWVQGGCGGDPGFGAHSDAVQSVGQENIFVIGNWFKDNSVHLGYYDGGSNYSVISNIFQGSAGGSGAQTLQIGGIQGMNFINNTLKDAGVSSFGTKEGGTAQSGWVWACNIYDNTDQVTSPSFQDDGCGADCDGHHNLFGNGGTNEGINLPNTDGLTGSPTYAGGAPPTTWYGWKLTGSVGVNACNDGGNVGMRYYKRGPVTGVN